MVANTLVMLVLALLLNNAIPRRHYPQMQAPTATSQKMATLITPEQADLEWALAQSDSALDINVEDLSEIYRLAQQHAQARNDSATH